jgi:chromosome segregation ATPase
MKIEELINQYRSQMREFMYSNLSKDEDKADNTLKQLLSRFAALEEKVRVLSEENEKFGFLIKNRDEVIISYMTDNFQLREQITDLQSQLEQAKNICPYCKQPWTEHDFGVPSPFCPNKKFDKE